MELMNRGILVALGLCLLFVPAASAENFVRVYTNPATNPSWDETSFVDIDVDSIRKGGDGLVYYTLEEDLGITTAAVNCQDRIYYLIGALPDWRSNGSGVGPDVPEAAEMNFVCARVR